jgi:outer membrane protein assembly factor BamD
VIEITNFQRDFPDSDYNEEMAYFKVVSQFDLAKSTVEYKQKERYEEVVKFYLELIDKYPQSSYLKTAEKRYTESQNEVVRIAKIEAEYKALQEKEKSNTSKIATSPQ